MRKSHGVKCEKTILPFSSPVAFPKRFISSLSPTTIVPPLLETLDRVSAAVAAAVHGIRDGWRRAGPPRDRRKHSPCATGGGAGAASPRYGRRCWELRRTGGVRRRIRNRFDRLCDLDQVSSLGPSPIGCCSAASETPPDQPAAAHHLLSHARSSLVLGNPWWRLMPVAQQKRRGRGCRSMRCEHAGRSCLMVALPLRSYLEAREAKPREGKPPIEN
jgi:hypothetical protein